MKYGYYPGCSLERNAIAYHQSAMAVAGLLGIEFVEVEDWNCCGATEYISVNLLAAYALVGRNLALAAQQQLNSGPKQMVAPCSACFLNLSKVDKYMGDDAELAEKVNLALAAGGLAYKPGSVQVRHLFDIVANDVGVDAVAARVTRPLYNLRLAPYYGCLIVRPNLNRQWDDPEYPTSLDRLMRALGAEVVDFPVKTHCCGGHMTQIGPSTAFELIRRLISSADQYQADIMVTVCPMCQMNLDAYQGETNRYFHTNYHMPIVFFTQLMGLAFGLEAKHLGFGKELVSAGTALGRIGIEVPEPEDKKARPKRTKPTGLPMPTMPGDVEVN